MPLRRARRPTRPARPRAAGRKSGIAAAGIVVILGGSAALALALAHAQGIGASSQRHLSSAAGTPPAGSSTTATRSTASGAPKSPLPAAPFPVGVVTRTFVDQSRLDYPPHTADGKPDPRSLLTFIRYPALGGVPGQETASAAAAASGGPYPLVVFAPGYDETPQPYSPLLDTWAEAGYVVAAPVFPLTNPAAPGGPFEDDIVNQPQDMSFLISQLLDTSAAPADPLYGLIDGSRIAVAGQSDGASTALAVADDSCCHDPRVRAALIFAGQEIDISGGHYYPPGGPPLLAAQGTSDTINPPDYSYQLFAAAPQPKFLLTLIGADHLGPFTNDPTYEPIVARVSADFLAYTLKGAPDASGQMQADAAPPQLASLRSS